MPEFLQDSTFWVAASFIIFVVLSFSVLKKNVSKSLDLKISSIKEEIEEAQKIKDQSIKMLNEIKKKEFENEKKIFEIKKKAESECKILESDSKRKLHQTLKKKLTSFNQRMEIHKKKVEEEIKQKIIETAIIVTEERIKKDLSLNKDNKIIENSIKDIKLS